MIDKIVLNIRHSDDYTDYLFMTAGLTNKRIIPLVNPGSEELNAAKDNFTKVLRCLTIRDTMGNRSNPISEDANNGSISVNTSYYLNDDGTINYQRAEIVRQGIEEITKRILLSTENIAESYKRYFPIFWAAREKIYADPKLYFVECRAFFNVFYKPRMAIGKVLKAMEEYEDTFRIRLGGGCSCSQKPLLIDCNKEYDQPLTLYTWCPVCGSRREIRAWNFQRLSQCERDFDAVPNFHYKGITTSPFCIFDLLDALRST